MQEVPQLQIDDEALEKLIRAGDIARRALEHGRSLIKPGATARAICVEVENYIRSQGAYPAFPCNFSVDHVAAHYTPGTSDDVELSQESVVKLDIGVSVDGYIADTALTVDLSGRHQELLEASREALEAVIKRLKPGISLYEIGKTVESRIRRRGFKVIRNLTGHTIARHMIHAGLSIPNYPDRTVFYKRLQPGTQAAIEPFATNGRGMVVEGGVTNIYAYTGRRPRKGLNNDEKKLLDVIVDRFLTLPFTPRWLVDLMDPQGLENLVRSLVAKGVLHDSPILVEAGRGLVSQHEHTVVILKDRVLVTTCKDCQG